MAATGARTRAGQSPRTARPRGTYETGGTRAVEEVRRQKAHQRYVGRLNSEEREAYERGGQQSQQTEQAKQAQRAEQQHQAQQAASRRKTLTTAHKVVSVGGSTTDGAAGFVLGLLVWGWVVLPFFTGGVTGVRNVLRAKFFNKAADGSWLP